MKEAFAAPDRGLPALLTALDSQSDAAVATCEKSILAANMQASNLDMAMASFVVVVCVEFNHYNSMVNDSADEGRASLTD